MRAASAVLIGLCFGFVFRTASAQSKADSLARTATSGSDGLLLIDDELHRFLDRQRTLGRLPRAHLAHKPLSTYEAGRYLDSLTHRPPSIPAPARGPLYRNGRDLWAVAAHDFGLQINPLLYLSYGRAGRTGPGRTGSINPRSTWRNTRGIRASGHIGPHLFFEARLEETQTLPAFTELDRITAPRHSFVRWYADSTAYDYQVGTGVVGFRTDHFEVRFGRDRNHWGFGEGSLILSDYAPLYDQLQIRTTFWRLQYINLFAAFTNVPPFGPIDPNYLPRKYGAFHRLSINVSERVNLSVFESVVFGPDTSSGRGDGFELAYLNPVIFYRTAEADLGSPDNVLVGGGVSWIAIDGLRLYGQFVLDEFMVDKLFSSSWENKTGYLAGVHVVPRDDLSVRAEYARLRPYLYTHRTTARAYLHYLDVIGHPVGPNAVDYSLFVEWEPATRWETGLTASYTLRGVSPPDENVGNDLRLNYATRRSDIAPFLDGIRQDRYLVEAYAGYLLLPKLHLEAALRAEGLGDGRSYVEPLVSLRWGLPFESTRY